MESKELFTLLNSLGISKLRQTGENIIGCCPIHGESNPSFGVSITKDKHLWCCFSCGAKGNLASLVAKVNDCSHKDALKYIAKYGDYDASISSTISAVEGLDKAEIKTVPEVSFAPYEARRARALIYLKNRGIDPYFIKDIRLGYDPEQRRVLFPYFFNKKFYGANGRTLVGDAAKTVTYFGLKKGSCIYVPRIRKSDIWILVEGEIDAIYLSAYLRFNVAALGYNHIAKNQEKQLLSLSNSWILLPDKDNGGRKLLEEFKSGIGEKIKYKIAVLPHTKDAAESNISDLLSSIMSANFLNSF